MESTTFEDLEAVSGQWRKPFFAIDYSNESDLHDWLKQEFVHLKSANTMRIEKIKNHYLRYKGIQYQHQKYTNNRGEPEVTKSYTPQMVVPLIRDMIDEKVARLLEFKPSISVLPVHDEERDKVDAKIAKRFLSHLEYTEKLADKFNRWVKSAKIAGESFLFVTWNPEKGDVHPDFKQGMIMPDGRVMQDEVHIGDVDFRPKTALHVYYEEAPSKLWEDVNYCFVVEYEYAEGLKKEYPDKADKIHGMATGVRIFDFEKMEDMDIVGRVEKITFYHKKTKYLPSGFEACFTDTSLLKSGKLPYNHGKLPCVRLVGTENEEELHGESSIEPVRGLASQITNQYNMAIKQFMICAYPKWFVEANSVDIQQLNNDVGIVNIKGGAKAPVLAQANPVSPQLLDFNNNLIEKFYAFAKSNSVVQGQPPTGVTAFVALQYVSESENRRLSTEVAQLNDGIISVYDLALQVAGQYYRKDDQRTMRIIGKNSQWLTSKYDPASLAKPYNIMLSNQTALPESRANRTQFLLDVGERFPDMVPREQLVEMLGLAQSEKFQDVASAAARAAEDENEHIIDTAEQIEPEPYEDLVTHWKIHVQSIQDIGFKTKTNPKSQDEMKKHIMATEMLMFDQAQKNPSFAQVLASLPMFPLLFTPPPPPPMPPMPQDPQGQGQPPGEPMPPPQQQAGPPPDAPLTPDQQAALNGQDQGMMPQ